ncbi:MAG: S-methyl-5-thioribose-1-phosphate isomerase [Acidimicrobiaceae bacterium]|jgi:methylthioribose-1-phosphate isomerase|nr:S-methyl-5-thioribose-1-phosphate isomerase [Acidimicrobiaceae bacterium]|tara:strand:+ start:3162 stop:4217 length:1056 start_codon:yes stop_codon:yes gene_type:complete
MKGTTPPVVWANDHIQIIDQTLLPTEVKIIEIRNAAQAVDAIQRLAIRGAPALGAFGSLALVVALDEVQPSSLAEAKSRLEECRTLIGDARPTAVNLRWAVNRVIDQATNDAHDLTSLRTALISEAHAVAAEDEAACNEIGRLGHELLRDASVIGTHCNAGRLATAGTGTALAPMYAKAEAGEPLRVLASETRPLLQGARLTAWELDDAGIDVTVVPDSAMASTVLSGQVDAYIVGADRIAANGDAANKIGTVGHALASREAGIPFYVAAPTSTIDIALATGNHIEIEQRDAIEVHEIGGRRLTPKGVAASNPAFDVTPNHLITAIITEAGVLRAPFKDSIAEALSRVGSS